MSNICLVIDNVRSIYNVGSLLRTADGLGIKKVVTVGITPTTEQSDDERLPHVIKRVESQLSKTALGAEKQLEIKHLKVDELKSYLNDYEIVALEQTDKSKPIGDANFRANVALVVGNEVDGVSPELIKLADKVIEIPMSGSKNSFNVSVAAAIAMYHIKTVENSS